METQKNYERMKKCPRFNKCSAPICYLDELKDRRVHFKQEQKCALSKAKRLKLGSDLPWKGLTPKELSAEKRWNEGKVSEKFIEARKVLKFRS